MPQELTQQITQAGLVALIVAAALGPAILDVARALKCAVVPCRCKGR
jgi:hypothetical protein